LVLKKSQKRHGRKNKFDLRGHTSEKEKLHHDLCRYFILIKEKRERERKESLPSLPQHFAGTPSISYFVLSARVGQWNKRENLVFDAPFSGNP
jgi:hypothetical protein